MAPVMILGYSGNFRNWNLLGDSSHWWWVVKDSCPWLLVFSIHLEVRKPLLHTLKLQVLSMKARELEFGMHINAG